MDALEIAGLNGIPGLRLAGELDLRTVRQLNEALAGIGTHGQVTLDLSEVTFIDSSGLHAIVDYARAQNGNGPLVLVGVSAMLLRILEITHLAMDPNLEIKRADGV